MVAVTGMLVFMLWMQVWPSKLEGLPAFTCVFERLLAHLWPHLSRECSNMLASSMPSALASLARKIAPTRADAPL